MSDTTTTATTTAPPSPATPPPAQTPEQTATSERTDAVRKAAQFLASKIISPEPKKKPEEKKEETPPPATPETKKSDEPPADEPKEKKPAKRQKEDLTPERIAEISANTAAAMMKQQRKEELAEAPPAPPAKHVELPQELEAHRPIYELLEKSNPKKYSGLITKLASYADKETEYIEAWVDENPGREFDPEDESHDDFYKKNQPKIDPTDVESAKDQLREERVRGKIMEELGPELSEIRQNKARQSIAPKAQAAATSIAAEVLNGINPEYSKHIADAAKMNEIGEDDPIAADVTRAVAGEFVPLAVEVVALHNGVPFDEKNQAHMAVYRMAKQMEDAVQSLPPSQQSHEGRAFATREEYASMDTRERSRHWIIDQDSLLYAIAEQAKAKSSSLYKHETEKVARYTKKKTPASATNGTHTPAPSPAPENNRANAPAVVPGRSVTPGTGNTATPAKTGHQRWLDRFGMK